MFFKTSMNFYIFYYDYNNFSEVDLSGERLTDRFTSGLSVTSTRTNLLFTRSHNFFWTWYKIKKTVKNVSQLWISVTFPLFNPAALNKSQKDKINLTSYLTGSLQVGFRIFCTGSNTEKTQFSWTTKSTRNSNRNNILRQCVLFNRKRWKSANRFELKYLRHN